MSIKTFLKDPVAVLDYMIDWAAWLGGDTIALSVWTIPSGITQNSVTNTATTATIWLSGGTDGTVYSIVNRITTAGGRADERTITITVQNQ